MAIHSFRTLRRLRSPVAPCTVQRSATIWKNCSRDGSQSLTAWPNRFNQFTVLQVAAICVTSPLKAMAAKPRISITLPVREYRELLALAEEHHISLAWLGRQAVVEFLERYKDRELQLPLALPYQRSKRG